MIGNPRTWSCYVVTDAKLSRGRSHVEVARAAIQGGADVIQYREKDGDAASRLVEARAIRTLCHDTDRIFVVNDHVDLAIAVEADVLHVGQDDAPAATVREKIGTSMRLGVSARTLDEALRAVDDGADHLGVGPIFDATTTKPDAARPLGLEGLARIRDAVGIPLIAIGGIDHDNAADVIAAGADGCAVISCIVGAEDVFEATRTLRGTIEHAKAARRSAL